MFLIQDEHSSFINHYLNIIATHPDGNVSAKITEAHEAMKYTILYKALTGDVYGRQAASIFLVNDNSQEGGVRIYEMKDLIEKAEETFDMEEAAKLEKKLKKQSFDLDDYLMQLRNMKKMGSFSSILKLLPGANKLKDIDIDEKEFVRVEAIICSMTKEERQNPKILNGQRRLRIAKGSGTTVEQINKFMKSFEMTQQMMKEMTSGRGMKNMMRNLGKAGIDTKALENLDLDSLNVDDLN